MAAVVASDDFGRLDPAVAAVLLPDGSGNPRSLRLFASLVEAEARRHAAAASQPAETGLLVNKFRGGAAPEVAVGDFLARAQQCFRLEGSCYVLAAVYLHRFGRSRAALDSGIVLEPTTAHRLAAVALLTAAKFASPVWQLRTKAMENCSGGAIRASELIALERPFLQAIDYRLYVADDEFRRFCKILKRGPSALRSCADGDRKRKPPAALGEEERRRRVRACRPPVAAA